MRILIACGGTAGHIFPGLALAEEIKKEGSHSQVVIVVSTHPRDREYLKVGSELLKQMYVETVSTIPLPYRFSPKYIPFGARLLWSFLKSFIIILRYAPEVVVGFGGYASFAPLIIARVIGIPTLIHEQNLMPGRVNRLLGRIADRIAVSFDDTNKFFPWKKSGQRIVKTGFPLRRHILDYKRDPSDGFTAAPEKFTILVVGGSQGAHNINELVLSALNLMDEEDQTQMHVIHSSGKRDFRHVKARYESLGVTSQVFDFLKDMAGAYRIADLLIARSGAGTIFEAASFGLPCILIPYSHGSKHQKENALYLERNGAALVLDEERTSCENLEKILQRLMANKSRRESLSQRIKMLENPGASHNLREQINVLYRARYVCE